MAARRTSSRLRRDSMRPPPPRHHAGSCAPIACAPIASSAAAIGRAELPHKCGAAAHLLEKRHTLLLEATVQPPASARVHKINQLLRRQIQQVVEVNATVGKLAEGALLLKLHGRSLIDFVVRLQGTQRDGGPSASRARRAVRQDEWHGASTQLSPLLGLYDVDPVNTFGTPPIQRNLRALVLVAMPSIDSPQTRHTPSEISRGFSGYRTA